MAKRKKVPLADPDMSPDLKDYRPAADKTWFGTVIRSAVAHGKIISIVHPPIPPHLTFLTHRDLKGSASFQVAKSKFPLLADDEVQYIGEPVALLAGPNEEEVREFAKHVRFVTRKMTLDEFSEDSLGLHQKELALGSPLSETEARELHVIEGIYTTGAQHSENFAPCEATANVTKEGTFVRVGTQWPALVVQSVAKALDVEANTVKVWAQTSSSSQNSQVWFTAVLAVHAALLSKACGKAVRIELTKEEEFRFSPKRPESRILLRSWVNPSGKIRFLAADAVIQIGAYGILEEEILDRMLVGLLATYQFEAYQVNAHMELSHTPPRGPVGGLGEALGIFAIESHVMDICYAFDLDPARWRLSNLVSKDHLKFTGEWNKLDSPLVPLIETLARVTDFSRKHSSYAVLHSKYQDLHVEALPLRGIGMSCAFQGNGFIAGGNSPVNVEGRLELDGSLSLYIPLITANERLIDLWKQSAAAALQIPVSKVHLCPVFHGDHPVGGPSIASRSFEIVTRLIVQTCEGIAQKRFRQPLPIAVHKVYRRTKGPAWDSENFTGQPFISTTYGACAVEVEVVPLLAEIRVKKVWLAVDAGPRLDESSARSALIEGVMLAMGWCITENLAWDKLQLSHMNFLKYRIPGPREVPEILIRFLDSGKDSQPRGLGDLGANLVAPALTAAIRQALSPDLKTIPLSRKMLDEALRNHEAEFNLKR